MSTRKISNTTDALSTACLISSDNSGAQIVDIGEFLCIGRDPSNGLELADPYVSSRHARIEKKETGYLLRDLRSQNGTYLNGNRVVEAFLNIGDRIRIGEREFSFQASDQSEKEDPRLKSKNELWSQQLHSIPSFARTDMPVILLGSSGTGKEVVARLIHDYSIRKDGPFVSVNCSALSESLIESELFGHVKGSFTGATHDRKGAFEAARGGTLFLDEIGDLPLSLQPKLLRALENKEIRPVGSDRNISTDVRIVSATHKNLGRLVGQGAFRTDLYYRLHVIKVLLPDLRERMEDFETILYSFAREMRVRFSLAAIEALKKHKWLGNVRELRNTVARASALFSGEQILERHIPLLLDSTDVSTVLPHAGLSGHSNSSAIPLAGVPAIRELEKEVIIKKLIENKGNQRRTALELGIPKSTLHDRLRTYGIDPRSFSKVISVSQALPGSDTFKA